MLAVTFPYTPALALLGVVLCLLCRKVFLAVAAVAIVAAAVSAQALWYYAGDPADVGQYAEIRLISSNLRKGQAEASPFVELAKNSADVIAVSELTPEAVQRFKAAGITEAFPFSVLKPAAGAGGIGLWSRTPLDGASLAQRQHTNMVAAKLEVSGVRFKPLVASVHITSPVTAEPGSFDAWQKGVVDTQRDLENFAELSEPAAVVVAGDFNSTPDMRQFRDLLSNGYRDAVKQTGAGFAPTFPSNILPGPLLVIDHVLIRNAAASSIRTVDVRGSDHRALLASIRVPLDPTAP
ncbi:endonuclease/exonuclease/phosphatase family protein [Mycolicibacterium elephantis]|nr:endonuclease/exonuclease/phosphatase family protein [Mycolicibacterium elephantis]